MKKQNTNTKNGVVANVVDCNIVGSEFETLLGYYIHFRAMIPTNYRLNNTI